MKCDNKETEFLYDALMLFYIVSARINFDYGIIRVKWDDYNRATYHSYFVKEREWVTKHIINNVVLKFNDDFPMWFCWHLLRIFVSTRDEFHTNLSTKGVIIKCK